MFKIIIKWFDCFKIISVKDTISNEERFLIYPKINDSWFYNYMFDYRFTPKQFLICINNKTFNYNKRGDNILVYDQRECIFSVLLYLRDPLYEHCQTIKKNYIKMEDVITTIKKVDSILIYLSKFECILCHFTTDSIFLKKNKYIYTPKDLIDKWEIFKQFYSNNRSDEFKKKIMNNNVFYDIIFE